MPVPPCPVACHWSACILWMHWVFVSKFAPANLQLQGGAITLETKAHIYTLYSSILFEYPIVPLLKFRSFALSSKPPSSKSLFFRWTFYRTAILPDYSISTNLQFPSYETPVFCLWNSSFSPMKLECQPVWNFSFTQVALIVSSFLQDDLLDALSKSFY